MNIVKNEIRTLQNFVSAEKEAHQRTRTEMGNALQKANARIAELEQRLNKGQ